MKHLSPAHFFLSTAAAVLLALFAVAGRWPVAASSDAAVQGAALFANSGCPQCHGPEGMGTTKAPSLRDIRKRKTDEEVHLQIKDGGKIMPPFGEALTDEQITALVEFLRSKRAWTGALVPAKAAAASSSTPSEPK